MIQCWVSSARLSGSLSKRLTWSAFVVLGNEDAYFQIISVKLCPSQYIYYNSISLHGDIFHPFEVHTIYRN
jgi:hypothetical protein